MALSAFDHLVVRVGDLDEGIATYRDTLGLDLDRTDENEALGIKQAFFNLPGGGFIEVVAPFDSQSAVGQALEKRGEGIHTVAFAVDDLDAACETLKAGGARLIGPQPSRSSQRKISVAAAAPASWARMKPGACAGMMPEKVSVRLRAIVTAGLAKEVEEVNQ